MMLVLTAVAVLCMLAGVAEAQTFSQWISWPDPEDRMQVQDVQVRRMGLPDKFIEHGAAGLLRERCGLDAAGIVKEATDFCR